MTVVQKVLELKKELNLVRKAVAPLHEVVLQIYKDESVFNKELRHYIHDMLEHIKQIQDSVEIHNDNLSAIVDLNLSGLSNNMNKVMQTFTIVASIFIPLSFVAGLYGMNFKYMPELNLRYGYYGVLIVMLVLVLFMLRYFKKNKWL